MLVARSLDDDTDLLVVPFDVLSSSLDSLTEDAQDSFQCCTVLVQLLKVAHCLELDDRLFSGLEGWSTQRSILGGIFLPLEMNRSQLGVET